MQKAAVARAAASREVACASKATRATIARWSLHAVDMASHRPRCLPHRRGTRLAHAIKGGLGSTAASSWSAPTNLAQAMAVATLAGANVRLDILETLAMFLFLLARLVAAPMEHAMRTMR